MSAAVALYVRDPGTREETYLGVVGEEASIGNGAIAAFCIDSLRCDPLHALLERDPSTGEFVIIDLGSNYGTYVKGKRVQESKLKVGELFVVGNKQMILRKIEGAAPAPANTPGPNPRPQGQAPLPDRLTDPNYRLNSPVVQERRKRAGRATFERDILQVTLFWGEKVLETRIFEPGSYVTLGSQKSATFGVSLTEERLQNAPYTVARYRRDQVILTLPPEASGLVWAGTDTYSLDFLRHKDKSTKHFGDVTTSLRTGDRADINFGELTLSFRFAPPAEKIPTQWIPRLDKTFFRIGCILAVIYAAMIFWVSTQQVQIPDKTLDDLPKNLKRSVYNAGLAKALRRRQAAIGRLTKALEGGRAKGAQGRATPKKEAVPQPKPAPAPVPAPKQVQNTPPKKMHPSKTAASAIRHAPVKKSVAKKGHENEATGAQEPAKVDLDTAFSTPTRSAATVVKNIDGVDAPGRKQDGNAVAAFSEGGGFASGTKGTGAGGGGQGVGIGSLKGVSTGGGEGAGDYGLLPAKGHEIKIPEMEEELVTLGGLDRDVIAAIIRRYLPQIQHCYEEQLALNRSLKGKVTVSFIISGSGSVQSADVQESSLHNQAVEKCMLQKIMGWKFPRPRGGGTVGVKYPFLLMSNSEGGGDE